MNIDDDIDIDILTIPVFNLQVREDYQCSKKNVSFKEHVTKGGFLALLLV